MTSAAVVEQLSRRVEGLGDLPELTAVEERLMRHLLVGAALLPAAAERYRGLRRRFDENGSDAALQAEALDAAGDIAAVLQGARDEHAAAVVLDETELSPLPVLSALEQVFYSLVLLTDQTGDAARLAMSADELDELLALPRLQDWLDPESALRRMVPPG
jgi:hypothetical protein